MKFEKTEAPLWILKLDYPINKLPWTLAKKL